jgi:histidyl-tRNA synthetase
VVIGDSELAREAAIVKDLANHTQGLVNLSILAQFVEKLLKSAANQSSGEVN